MAQVSLKGVSKVFAGNITAVNSISLGIENKEFVVLVGPSGCGKSTTLRMVAGLETPTDGQIWIGDKLVNNVPPKHRDIAMVFQNYALYPHMTVYENMAFHCRKSKYIPVPDSGRTCAIKLSESAKIRYREGLIKNRYIHRTFIMPSQTSREKGGILVTASSIWMRRFPT